MTRPLVSTFEDHVEDKSSAEPKFKSRAPPQLSIPGAPTVLFHFPVASCPYRSTSRGDFLYLGDGNGTLSIVYFGDDPSNKLHVQYHDVNAKLFFSSKIPSVEEAHNYIKRPDGSGSEFEWDALNERHEEGGTTIRGAQGPGATGARRYYFQFQSEGTLSMVLYHMFHDGYSMNATDLVIDFFDSSKLFYKDTKTIPPHTIIKMKNENDMDTDDDDTVQAGKPLSPQVAKKVYGNNPYNESQPMY